MSGQHSLTPHPERRVAFDDWKTTATSRQSPCQNRLLAALPAADYQRLLPDLEPVLLPYGWTIHSAGGREDHILFLTAGIVARFRVTESGGSSEFAVTGNEGVIGVASFLGGESTLSQALVLSAGSAYRLGADALKRELDHDGPLPQLLLRYTLALIRQTAQTAACNRHHSLEQRLCRWILSCLDRLPTNQLTMTQEQVAEMLGVRRVGVTAAAGRLQKAGLIHYSRGHIAVLDRPRLETQACECYAVVKREYDRLLPPQRVVANARVHGTCGIPCGAAA